MLQKLFKGRNYSRAETIRGNTVLQNFITIDETTFFFSKSKPEPKYPLFLNFKFLIQISNP